MIRMCLIAALVAASLAAGAEPKAPEWTNDKLIAHVLNAAEKLDAEYAQEKPGSSGDLDAWRELDYYASKLRTRLFVRSRDKTLSAQKMADLQWLARESEERGYRSRFREGAAQQFKELKTMLAEIKEQLKTSAELPRGAAFQLKSIATEGGMRPMQVTWKPPKGEEVDED